MYICFSFCGLEMWWMTLKNNRVPLLCHSKLYASFRSHRWIQTGVTVQKQTNWGKISFDLCDLDLWPLTLTFCMDITLVSGYKSCKIHDDTMRGNIVKKVCHRQKDRRTDGRMDGWTDRWTGPLIHRAAWPHLNITVITRISSNSKLLQVSDGVLSDIEWLEWLNTTQLRYPDCVCIVESDTYPSPGVTRLRPSWLGTWLTWSPSGHCNMQWDTCYHLVPMAAGTELPINHITWLHYEEYWNIHRKFKTPKWHSNRYPVVLILNLLV